LPHGLTVVLGFDNIILTAATETAPVYVVANKSQLGSQTV